LKIDREALLNLPNLYIFAFSLNFLCLILNIKNKQKEGNMEIYLWHEKQVASVAIDIRALSIGLFLPLPIVFFVLSNQRLEESLEDNVVPL